MSIKKLLVFLCIFLACILFAYYFGLSDYVTLKRIQDHHAILQQFVCMHYLLSVIIYIAIFSICISCALPIVMPFALVGGFLYGFALGVLYAGISCLIGSIASFLVMRYVIAYWIRDWHNARVDKFHLQVQKYGYWYLIILHFLSIIPLFVINLLAAIANVPLIKLIGITILGTLPLNVLCAFAGQRLSSIHSFGEIFSPTIICALLLLALIACAPLFIEKLRKVFGV